MGRSSTHVHKSTATTSSTKSPFEIFYGEKPKIIGSFSDFRRIAYVTKREILRYRRIKIRTRQSWLDIPKTIQETHTSFTTQKPQAMVDLPVNSIEPEAHAHSDDHHSILSGNTGSKKSVLITPLEILSIYQNLRTD